MKLPLLVVSALIAATPVAVQAEDHSGHDMTAPAKPAKEKKICRENPDATGSRLDSGKICKTAAGWAAWEASRRASPVTSRSTHSFRPDDR